MANETTVRNAYVAFNKRDIDAALALMTDDVHWPKASEGGSVIGKEAIRAYWTRQWSDFNPHVEPVSVSQEEDGTVRVRVHQVVKDLNKAVLSDSEVVHVFTLRGGLIAAMELGDAANASSAFHLAR